MLTYFCKSEGLSYKQGINDVMAPFLWLAISNSNKFNQEGSSQKPNTSSGKKKRKDQSNLSESVAQFDLEEPYIMARQFIRKFQTNLFLNDDFYALQSCLSLFKLLLFYHDPVVAKHLENNNVTPELYCIPWFITYFASRIESASLVLEFWDFVMTATDEASSVSFIFFFATALVVTSRETILRSDQADLPQLMSQLSIKTREDLHTIMRAADDLQDNTPYSFKQIEELKGLFMRQ